MRSPLTISIIQTDLHWEDKQANLSMLDKKIELIPKESHIILLPEMFTTGFSMLPQKFAENMNGDTLEWLKNSSRKYKKIICGSIIIKEGDYFFNRLLWVLPNGAVYHYDKKHLFGFAGEDEYYKSGNRRLVVQVNGWKICPLICYDLRFPVWARQNDNLYDVLIYIANWPQRRNHAWKTLLQARAIENQSFVIGVNRVGNDGNNISHSGDSSIIDPLGDIVWQQEDEETIYTYTFENEKLNSIRTQFPFLEDRDTFMIT